MNNCIIFALMAIILIIISMADLLHKKQMNEKFSEQVRFSKSLLQVEEDEKDDEYIEDTKDTEDTEDPVIVINRCKCPVTEFNTIKVDTLLSDKGNKITFGDKVSMNEASINNLYLDETPFASYDSETNKLIIG